MGGLSFPRGGGGGLCQWMMVVAMMGAMMGAMAQDQGGGEVTAVTALTAKMASAMATASTEETAEVFEPAKGAPSRSEAAAVQRVKMRSGEKKDLGTLGYVLGLVMVVIIIAIGAGIVVGYVYKRGRDLKAEHDQKVYEREMQRITLPLTAFTNQACELVDENAVVAHTNQTPVEDSRDGDAPLMGQAGTPGA